MIKINKGTNISHWLSQSDRRGMERKAYFTREDIMRIADFGFDHIRLPVDEVQMWSDDGKAENEAFDLLNEAIYWGDREKLKVVVDLHILRTHYFNDKEEPRLFTDSSESQRFVNLWKDLSSRIREWPVEKVAYELLNEPVARDPQSWNRVGNEVFAVLRNKEPSRTILFGSNWFSQVQFFDCLELPKDDNLIMTFHYYFPMILTHYRASWWEGKDYEGPVNYPGYPVEKEVLDNLKAPLREKVKSWNKYYDRNVIIEDLGQPLAKRNKTGNPLYCGEFGCIKDAPEISRINWYRDMVSIFKELDIAFANWDYRGSFGILTEDRVDTGIAAIIIG